MITREGILSGKGKMAHIDVGRNSNNNNNSVLQHLVLLQGEADQKT
jgi:hypothetical protein